MTKKEFLEKFRESLSGLTKDDIEERLAFYGEMIDDRMEDGLSEEEAVAAVGSVDDICARELSDPPFAKPAKEKIMPRKKLKGWEIALLVIGSPLWLSLVFAAACVVFAVYISLWSAIVSLWAGFASLAACSAYGLISAAVKAFTGSALSGLALLGGGIACAGLAIFMFFACKKASEGIVLLTKKCILQIKKSFMKKEEAR